MEILGEIAFLMSDSPLHKRWYIEDLRRLILPPISFGQYVTHRIDTGLVGFGSWAFMNQSSLDDFLGAKRKINVADFISGDIPVLVDIIAPFGHAKEITSKMRKVLIDEGFSGEDIWFVRYSGDKRVVRKVRI